MQIDLTLSLSMWHQGDALDNNPGETKVSVGDMAAVANQHGITMVVDAAAVRDSVDLRPFCDRFCD